MQGIKKLLTSLAVGTVLAMNFAAAAEGQTGSIAKTENVSQPGSAVPATTATGAVASGAPSADDVSELKSEMKQLRALVEQQQAQIEKLRSGSSPSNESPVSTSPAQTPTPTLSAAPQAAGDSAPEQMIRPFKIGGFANWAYGKTNNANEYDLATQHGRFDNIDMGLILTLGLTPHVNATAQVSFQSADDHTETDVDFAFLDWKVNDKLNVRAGQIKNPFGLYSEYQGIGTVYPFNDTPQSIYGGTSIGNEFYRGIGITGIGFTTKKWEMDYDLFFGGGLNDEVNPAESIREAIAAIQPTVTIEGGSEEIRQTFGGRLTLARPDNGFKFGINGNTGISPDKGRHNVVGLFASYDTSKWLLRSEFASSFEPGFVHFNGVYVEAGYKVTQHWQPIFRYERARQSLANSAAVPDQFKSHSEVAGGLNYWVNPKAVVKFSYHHVEGNLLSVQRGELDITNLSAVPKTTDLATFGLGFVF